MPVAIAGASLTPSMRGGVAFPGDAVADQIPDVGRFIDHRDDADEVEAFRFGQRINGNSGGRHRVGRGALGTFRLWKAWLKRHLRNLELTRPLARTRLVTRTGVGNTFETRGNSLTTLKVLRMIASWDGVQIVNSADRSGPQNGNGQQSAGRWKICWNLRPRLLIGADVEVAAGDADADGITRDHVDQRRHHDQEEHRGCGLLDHQELDQHRNEHNHR